MTPLKKAELFAKTKHGGELNEIGVPHSNHLENVVSRLKSLGVIDEEVLCAGWLQDILENTDTGFDELFEKFEFSSKVVSESLRTKKGGRRLLINFLIEKVWHFNTISKA